VSGSKVGVPVQVGAHPTLRRGPTTTTMSHEQGAKKGGLSPQKWRREACGKQPGCQRELVSRQQRRCRRPRPGGKKTNWGGKGTRGEDRCDEMWNAKRNNKRSPEPDGTGTEARIYREPPIRSIAQGTISCNQSHCFWVHSSDIGKTKGKRASQKRRRR